MDVQGQRARGGGRGPPRGTHQDRGRDREGGHGSTSQLNLTISLPREAPLCHFCPPFRDALNQLAGQTSCDLTARSATLDPTPRVGKSLAKWGTVTPDLND